MNITLSRALYGTLFVGSLTLLGTTAAHAADTSGDNGTLSGSQVIADVTAPILATGNAISVVGDSASTAPDRHRHRHLHLHRRLLLRLRPRRHRLLQLHRRQRLQPPQAPTGPPPAPRSSPPWRHR